MPKKTSIVPWTDLASDVAAAIQRVATCRAQVLTRRNTPVPPTVNAAPFEVIAVRTDGTITAADGYVMHQERVSEVALSPLLDGCDSAAYWVHAEHLVRAPVRLIPHHRVLGTHTIRVTLDELFVSWLQERCRPAHRILLLHGRPKGCDPVASGQVIIGTPEDAIPNHAEAALFGWQSEDASIEREWIVIADVQLLQPLLALHDEPARMHMHLTPTVSTPARVEPGVIAVRSGARVSMLMSMMTEWTSVEALKRRVSR